MAEVAFKVPGATICCSTIHRCTFFTSCDVDPAKGSVVMLNCEKRTISGKIWVEPWEDSVVFQRPNPDVTDGLKVIEACAGIGAMGRGFHACQVETTCYNDYNPRFCAWLRQKTSTPAIEGNMTHPITIHAIHQASTGAQVITGGVACQPFSSLEDRKEQCDQRSESFTGLLALGYFLKCFLIIMECTREGFQSPWAQSMLNQFCLQTGFQCRQTVLHLHQLWPSMRTRWWAVLFHPSLTVQNIPPVPSLQFEPSVVHLFPRLLSLSHEDIQQLQLSFHELAGFQAQPKGLAGCILDIFKAMPTATHSWGSQLVGCACGCRDEGF